MEDESTFSEFKIDIKTKQPIYNDVPVQYLNVNKNHYTFRKRVHHQKPKPSVDQVELKSKIMKHLDQGIGYHTIE